MRRLALLLPAMVLAVTAGTAEPLPVGHRSLVWTDPDRDDRAVSFEVYYPATAAGENAPVADGRFAAIVFGHGYLLPVSAYGFVVDALAPAGFLVALPTTGGELFPNHALFGGDLAFLAARLRAEDENPASPFFGHVSENAAVAGHSMGGGASLLAAASDPSLAAVWNLAAAETNPSAIVAAASVAAPALLFAGSLDCVTPPAAHQIPMYDALASACRTFVSVSGGSHCQFAAGNGACNLGEIGCPSPTISRAAQHATVIGLLLPWLRYHLNGDSAAGAEFEALLAAGAGITSMHDCPATDVADGCPPPTAAGLTSRPNPFNPAVTILFRLPVAARVRLAVFDTAGRRVRALADAPLGAGEHGLPWDGKDDGGRDAPSGVYFALLRAAGEIRTARMVLIR